MNEATLEKLGRLLRPSADLALPALVEWFDGVKEVKEAKKIASFCCGETILGSYSREVVRRAFEGSSNRMFQVLADYVLDVDSRTFNHVEEHLSRAKKI